LIFYYDKKGVIEGRREGGHVTMMEEEAQGLGLGLAGER